MNATPKRETRYGSSPNVSSVRPQRGSRQTSSTGARPWCAPTARIWTRIASASSSARSGSQVLARPIACGKTTASRAISPEQISSWTIAGIPRRVSSTSWRWIAFASARRALCVERARARDPRDLARGRSGGARRRSRRARSRRRAGRPTHFRAARPSPPASCAGGDPRRARRAARDASRYGGSTLSTTVNVRPRAAGRSRGRRAASAAACGRERAPSRRSGE